MTGRLISRTASAMPLLMRDWRCRSWRYGRIVRRFRRSRPGRRLPTRISTTRDMSVYIVVKNECWEIDQVTGRRGVTLSVPWTESHTNEWWGYLVVFGDSLVGTAEKPGASFGDHKNMCPILEGNFRPVISSDGIFAGVQCAVRDQIQHDVKARFCAPGFGTNTISASFVNVALPQRN